MFLTTYTLNNVTAKGGGGGAEVGTARTQRYEGFETIPPDGGGGSNENWDSGTGGGTTGVLAEYSEVYPYDCEGDILMKDERVETRCTCHGQHTLAQIFDCTCIAEGGDPPMVRYVTMYLCVPYDDGGDPDVNTGTNNTNSGGGTSSSGDNETPSVTVIVEEGEDECVAVYEVANNYYSSNSPFNVDLSSLIKTPCDEKISTDEVENEKLLCIYDKITKSSKFKNLFTDTFGDSENLNVKFRVSDTISENGLTVGKGIKIDPRNGKIISADLEILINKDILNNNSAISVAKTVIHEALHAYLIVKQYGCDQSTPFQEMGEEEIGELLNEYFRECETNQGQHEFMFNFMIPTMSGILADIKDDLIPAHHQLQAEDFMFINEDNPSTWPDGTYKQDTPWSWETFYKYLSMAGLHNSSAFHFEMLPKTTPKYINYKLYSDEYGRKSFEKNCSN